MSYNPNSIQPPRGWQPSVDPNQQMIPPPIGSRVNESPSPINHPPMSWTVSTVRDSNLIPPPIGSHPVNLLSGGEIQPPIGSAPVNLLAGQGITPPVGSSPTNYMGQPVQPPRGADLNPVPTGNVGRLGPDPTVSTFSEARFYAENHMIPPPIGSSPANQLSGVSIPPPTTWVMSPPDRR
jgi:hypothetical protein